MAYFASGCSPIILKANASTLGTSEESVSSVMLLIPVSSWLLMESGGGSAALAVGLESLLSLSIRMRVQQLLVVWLFRFMCK